MKSRQATGAGLRPRHRRRWIAAAFLATAASAVAPFAVVQAAATTTAPQIKTVASHTGSATVTLGHPKPEATAQISPQAVAYNPANGDEALGQVTPTVTRVPTPTNPKTPSKDKTVTTWNAHVYLIAGADEPNEYHIETAPTTYGPLVEGDVYLVAGSGSLGQVADPGAPTSTTGGSTSPLAVKNPVAPQSVGFDRTGNLLINGYVTVTQVLTSGIQVVPKTTCSSSCPYQYSTLTAGNLYTVAGEGMRGITRVPAVRFTFGVRGWGLAVDSQGNFLDSANGMVLYVNVSTSPVTRYGKTIDARTSMVVAGTVTTGPASHNCGGGTKSLPATGPSSPNLTETHPYLDASGNLYLNDTSSQDGAGCVWVVPANSGTLNGLPVTQGEMYSLTGSASTPAFTNGATASTSAFGDTSAVTIDPAGNLVVALSGTHPAVRVIAESDGTYYGQAMTKGDAYLISGGPTATRTTTPGKATGFEFAGVPLTSTPPEFGITSLVDGAPGDLLLANGATATTATVYEITGAPTSSGQPKPTIVSVTPSSGPEEGGTTVTITGTNLKGASVTFGTTPATVTTTSASSVTAVTPPHALGPVAVTVETQSGTATDNTAFTFIPATPTLASVTPITGSTVGGTEVALDGTNLSTASAVHFGSGSATTVRSISPTEVTAVDPGGSGTVSVSVTTPGGTATLPTAFTYVTGTPPGPPTTVAAVRAGTGAVKISWSAPPTVVTRYSVTATPGGFTCKTADLTCTITGLTNGTTYGFTVAAINLAGTTAAPPEHLVPGTPPAAPGTPTAVRGVDSVTVRWTAPTPTASGFPVSSYTVTSSPTGRSCTAAGSTTHVCTVATLKAGTPYTFTVTATNAVGTGPASTASNASVPESTGEADGYWEAASDGGIFAFGKAQFYGSMGGKPLDAPIVAMAPTPTGGGYWEVASDGGVFAFGNAQFYGSMGGRPLDAPIVGVAPAPTGGGYWEVASDGGIFAFGSAAFDGSMGGKPLNAPIADMAPTPTGGGYWEVASDGGVFAFGSAAFDGSMGGKPLNAPVVGLSPTEGGT